MTERVKEADEVYPALSRVEKAHRTTRTVVLSFAASMVIYTAVGLVIAGERQASEQAKVPILLAAVVLSFASIAVRRVQLGHLRVEAVAHRRGLNGLINHLFTTTLISAALGEAIGVMAVVISFLGGRMEVILLGVIGLMMVLSNYPRRAAWEEAVEHFAATLPQ